MEETWGWFGALVPRVQRSRSNARARRVERRWVFCARLRMARSGVSYRRRGASAPESQTGLSGPPGLRAPQVLRCTGRSAGATKSLKPTPKWDAWDGWGGVGIGRFGDPVIGWSGDRTPPRAAG